MKTKHLLTLPLMAITLFFVNSSCQEAEEKEEVEAPAGPDLEAIKAEIQSMEDQWAAAINAKDIDALTALYADDVVSMPDNAPTLVGKAALAADSEAGFAENTENNTTAFVTQEVFSEGNQVLEIGTSATSNAAGEVIRTGKYMALFEKRDGKYLCIREIYNKDAKE